MWGFWSQISPFCYKFWHVGKGAALVHAAMRDKSVQEVSICGSVEPSIQVQVIISDLRADLKNLPSKCS